MLQFITKAIIALLLVALSLSSVVGKGLRGSPSTQDSTTMNEDPSTPTPTTSSTSFANRTEYLKRLKETSGSNIFTIPAPNEQNTNNVFGATVGSGGTNIVATFPSGVFDISRANDIRYIMDLQSRCSGADRKTPEETLGCHIYFDNSEPNPPFALGGMTLGTNLYNAQTNGLYDEGTFFNIFNDNATAVMIHEGCWMLDTSFDAEDDHGFNYYDSSSYSESFENNNEVKVGFNIGFGPFSFHSGYNRQTSNSGSRSDQSKVFYGEYSWWSQVGLLTNRCLNSPQFFQVAIKDNNLIKREVIDMWEEMQTATSAADLANTSSFQTLAQNGLQVPTAYMYGASAKYIIYGHYEDTSSSSASSAKRAINAGLHAVRDGVNGTIDAGVDHAIQNSAESSDLSIEFYYDHKVVGGNLSTDCFSEETCDTDVRDTRNAMRSDLNNLGDPYIHHTFTDMDHIVLWQTGKGLGSTFSEALKNHYSYAQCITVQDPNDVANPSFNFDIFNGYGETTTSSNSCNPFNICTSALYQYDHSIESISDVESHLCTSNPDPTCQIKTNDKVYVSDTNNIYQDQQDCLRHSSLSSCPGVDFFPSENPPNPLGGACGIALSQQVYSPGSPPSVYQSYGDCLANGNSYFCNNEWHFVPSEN